MAIVDWEYRPDYAPEGCARLFHRSASPGEGSLSVHSLPFFQLVWIREGGGTYNVMGREYPFRAGDLFLFAERETHYVQRVEADPPLYMESLIFSRRFLSKETDVGIYAEYLRIFADRSPEYSNRISGRDGRTQACFDALRGFYEDARLPAEQAACRIRARLLLLLTQLALDYPQMLAAQGPHLRREGGVRAAVRYIDEHFAGEVTLDELAEQAGLARSYFSAAFKRVQGMSPWDYLTAKRVDCAIQLMTREGRSVTGAAIESGFNNTANFNRAFRRYTGLTPTQYLHSLQDKED